MTSDHFLHLFLSEMRWAHLTLFTAKPPTITEPQPQPQPQPQPKEDEKIMSTAPQASTKAAATPESKVTRPNVDIIRRGTEIILPDDMETGEAIEWLVRKVREEDQTIGVSEYIDAFPLEGAWALQRVVAQRYGFSLGKPIETWFGEKIPPPVIGVEVDCGKTEQVIWGRFEVPAIAGWLAPDVAYRDGRLQFQISGEIKNRSKGEVAALAAGVREFLKTNSLYRGKAIRVKFETDPRKFNPIDCPKFIPEANAADPKQLVLTSTLGKIVQTSIFTPIEHTRQCREYKIPLKRGILLEGTYGTGKTLTAFVAARKCIENGWTFIYLETVKQLAQAIQFAKGYQPCVIFAEDIDRSLSGERDEEMDEILNTIDGIDSKQDETMVVLTTNDVKRINVAMLRPGRLDTVISFAPPDADAAIRLVHTYARDLLPSGEDLTHVGQLLAGKIPAFIREIVERSKLAAMAHTKPGERLALHAADLEVTAESMNRHLDLLKEEEEDERSAEERAADRLGGHIVEAFKIQNGSHVEGDTKVRTTAPKTNGHREASAT